MKPSKISQWVDLPQNDVAEAVVFLSDNQHQLRNYSPVDCGVLAESIPTYPK